MKIIQITVKLHKFVPKKKETQKSTTHNNNNNNNTQTINIKKTTEIENNRAYDFWLLGEEGSKQRGDSQ